MKEDGGAAHHPKTDAVDTVAEIAVAAVRRARDVPKVGQTRPAAPDRPFDPVSGLSVCRDYSYTTPRRSPRGQGHLARTHHPDTSQRAVVPAEPALSFPCWLLHRPTPDPTGRCCAVDLRWLPAATPPRAAGAPQNRLAWTASDRTPSRRATTRFRPGSCPEDGTVPPCRASWASPCQCALFR